MNDKQKIAFVCHPYHRGGVTRWMADAALAYSKNGVEVYFITVDPVKPFHSGKDREKMVNLLIAQGEHIRLISPKVNFTFEFGTEDFRAEFFKDAIIKNVPHGVPLIASDDSAVWKAAAAVADIYPMVGVLHGNNDYYYEKARQYQEQLSICVCVSNRIRKTVAIKCDKIDPQRLFIISCGINLPVFEPVSEQNKICRLIFIGRTTDYEKRADDLVKISVQLHKQGKKFHLDIVGNTKGSEVEFTNRLKEGAVDSFVSFHGWMAKAEIQKLLDNSDVLLLTSNSEGMPLVMMEALASGCGFTGTRVSGIEDYEHHPLSARCLGVYAIGDIEDAVNKISKVYAVPLDVRRHAARKLAEMEFSMQVCIEKYNSAIAAIKSFPIVAKEIKLSHFQRIYSKTIAFGRYLKVRICS